MDNGLVTSGKAALAGGDWAAARDCFERAARSGDPAEALDGLAQALFSAGDYAGAIDRGEQAFAAYRARGDDVRAAACARFVGYLHGAVYGNPSALSGWLARAVRLVEAAGDCPERARIELTRATVTDDPEARERHLSTAAEIAGRCGETDLVFDAMSQRGLHLVADGDVGAGMALLDESLAAVAAGEVRDLVSVGAMYCKMLHACELTSDVRRAEDWLALADRFVARTNRIPIGAICRTHYGGVLTAAGRWEEAERELAASISLYDRSFRALRGAAVVRLADLRVRQGRLAEAAELLAGAEHDSHAVRPRVELHLARGEAELAAAGIERFFRSDPPAELAAPILLLLVRARLALGDPGAAAAAGARLGELAAQHSHALLAALADHAAGLVAAEAGRSPGAGRSAGAGDPAPEPAVGAPGAAETESASGVASAEAEVGRVVPGVVAAAEMESASGAASAGAEAAGVEAAGVEAVRRLEAALAAFGRLGLPLEEARARLDLAGVLAAAWPAVAIVEARAALERFQALSATRDADAATSLLRRLGVRGHTGPRGAGTLTAREEEVLALLGQGLSNADIAARLYISRRTAEHHVSNILAKLGLGSRAEATAFSVRRDRIGEGLR